MVAAIPIVLGLCLGTGAVAVMILVSKHVDELTAEAERAWDHKDTQGATELLRRAQSAAWLLAPWRCARVRMRLGRLYAQTNLRHEAATELRASVRSPFLPLDLKRDAKLLLADVLDSLGDRAAATVHRDAVHKARRGQSQPSAAATGNVAACLDRGNALQRTHKYEEAIAEYEKGLGDGNASLQEKLLVRIALASGSAGHPAQAIHWCENLLSAGIENPIHLRAAHGLAALSYANLGNLISAESHARERVRLAGEEVSQRCAALGILSTVLLQKGDVHGAIEMAQQADRIGVGDAHHRAAWRALSDAYLQSGRLGDAIRLLQTVHESKLIERKQPDLRSDAADAVAMARVHLTGVAAGQVSNTALDRSRTLLETAFQAFAGDPRASLPCDAAVAWLLSAEGKGAEAVGLIADVERRRQEFQPANRGLAVDCLAICGHVSFALGGYRHSAGYWQERLKICNPLAKAESAFWLARCLEAMGDSRALYVYERAAATGVETIWLGLSRERLSKSVVFSGPDSLDSGNCNLDLRTPNTNAAVSLKGT